MRWKRAVFSIGAVVSACASAVFARYKLLPGAYQEIQAGIHAAFPGDAVRIAPAPYSGDGNQLLFVSEPGGRLAS
jgi:hypothetical protein